MKILGKGNKSKRGFTLIELMVVVIVVGILAAAAVPIYRFAMSRAYSSEAKATIGTMMSSMRVFAAETADGSYPASVFGTTSDTTGSDLFEDLGVDTTTNTWWHAGVADDTNTTTCTFGSVAAGGSKPTDLTKITLDSVAPGPYVWAIGDVAAATTIYGIQLLYDMGADTWYTAF